MFSGLVQEIGKLSLRKKNTLAIEVEGDAPKNGDSIAVNGVCLTVVRYASRGKKTEIFFELSEETFDKTTLGALKGGSNVNVERALTLHQGLGGHLVQGHVDGTGVVKEIIRQGEMKTIWIEAPSEIAQYLVSKGSVTVDGVSLTSAELDGRQFSVALIPYTLEHTTLGKMKEGDRVNLEADVIGKYVAKYMKER